MNEKRREQIRRAQARFRKRHAQQLAQARTVMKVLLRQERYDDIALLADSLRQFLTSPGIAALRAALGRRRYPIARRRYYWKRASRSV